MTSTPTPAFGRTLRLSEEWLDDVAAALHTDDRQHAYVALRAVLHALRDRLLPTEAAHLAAQLPMLLRGVYYEGWHPAGKPEPIYKLDAFLERVASEITDPSLDPSHATRSVFAVLQHRISAGEVADVTRSLPEPIRVLWQPPARETREHPAP